MCRLLAVQSKSPFAISGELEKFAHIAQNSREYQGHGWGCSWLDNGRWKHYKNIRPIWEDDLKPFSQTTVLMAHARSAFKDQDIVVENNMPFYEGKLVFIFNGELRGVRINAEGRIGAEKIFNFIRRFEEKGLLQALAKGVDIIGKRSRYVRAMNIIMGDGSRFYLSSLFNEDQEYFTMHYKRWDEKLTICSDPFADEDGWQAIPNKTTKVFSI